MLEKETKEATIKLDETQFQHLLVILNDINQGLKSAIDKQAETNIKLERLENAITKLEGELRLIRIEMKEKK